MSNFKDLSAVGVANIVPTAIGGLFWFYVASLVQVEEYGEINYLLAIAGVAGIISMLGAGSSITVYTAKGENIVPTISFFVILSSVVASIILYIILENLGTSIWVVGFVIFGIITAELLGSKMYKQYAKFVIFQRVLMVVFAILFYYLIGYQGIIIGIGLSFVPFSFKLYQSIKGKKIKINDLKLRKNFLLNNYVLELTRTLSGSADKLIIAPYFGFALLGNYQLGVQLLSLLTIIPVIVYQYTLPRDSKGEYNLKLKRLTIIVSIIIAIISFFVSPILIMKVFPKYLDAVDVVKIISFVIIPITINLMYISEFLGKLKSKIVLMGSGIFLATQIPAIIILGEFMGITGIAAGLLLGSSAESIYLFLMKQKIQNLEKV
jgi:O-antigen/teichoic acid export membrane protein